MYDAKYINDTLTMFNKNRDWLPVSGVVQILYEYFLKTGVEFSKEQIEKIELLIKGNAKKNETKIWAEVRELFNHVFKEG